MESVKNKKLENDEVSNQVAPCYTNSGPGGIRQISIFLERIQYPPEEIPAKAEEIWREWLRTGHWWIPTFGEFIEFLEGDL